MATDRIPISIDGRTAEVPRGTTILDAARAAGVSIPTLCNYRGLLPYGVCRVCLVELQTPRGGQLVASCSHPITSSLTVRTETPDVQAARRVVLELLLAQAPDSKELAAVAAGLGVTSTPFQPAAEGKCILCGLCTRVCNEMMGRGAINLFGRGESRQVRTAFEQPTMQCQACGACAFVCPTGAIDLATITARRVTPHQTGFDQYLTARPCIDLAHPQAAPRVPVIDRDNCIHFRSGQCGLCSQVCQAGAIDYEQEPEKQELEVGSVVLTPGFEAFDATRRGEFGYGLAPNVLSSVQFERMLSAAGPTQGHIRRVTDGRPPKRLAFIQCVGSRDSGCDNDYCSSICCMAATKEAILAKEHEPGLDVTIFFLDLRAFGKDFDRYCDRAKNQLGVRYVRSFVSRLYEMPDNRNLRLVYADPQTRPVEEEFDLVVLSLGLEPSASLQAQAERLGVLLNRWGFAQTDEFRPLDTSRPGVFVGGAFQEPKDIPDTVMQASAAAARAMTLLAPARGTRVRTKTYPPERDIADEPPRVGIFVCHCGSNIASVVDVARVVAEAHKLPHVVLAESNTYTCADDNQDRMKQKIVANRLNRVVVASCTPRTHEPIFRDTLRDAGLNPYLLEMANIRDQCSWVHSGHPDAATRKAIDLVRMAAARAAQLQPLEETSAPVNSAALVVGGGIAGMTAALALADQGFPVHLVERSAELGGTARRIHRTLEGHDVQALLAETIGRVSGHPRITVNLRSRVTRVAGHVGEFTSQIVALDGDCPNRPGDCPNFSPTKMGLSPSPGPSAGQQSREIHHGVVVVATGAEEQPPTTYAYGRSDRVLTQLELSDRLGRGQIDLPPEATVAMIQCVEQRDEKRPYCSRVCCTTAVKNALELKRRWPAARIVVLYRDMRTYGFRESAYREAREAGVLFVRYEPEHPPELEQNGTSRTPLAPREEISRTPLAPREEISRTPLAPREEGHHAERDEYGSSSSAHTKLRLRFNEPSLGRPMTIEPDLVVLAAPAVPAADRAELSELLRVPLNADGFFLEAHVKLRPVDFASEGLFLCGAAHAPKFIAETISQATAVAGRAAAILSRKRIPVSGQIAWVDPDQCISCMTCVHVCPYLAPRVGPQNKAEVQGAVCMGCGSCSAECPAKAITLRHFVDIQILAAMDGLLDPDRRPPARLPVYPEEVGVAQNAWKTS
ncbi:MAG: 2Fe-2S iron-sulfur cluster-binding protein [Thermoguttaceae bacterium]